RSSSSSAACAGAGAANAFTGAVAAGSPPNARCSAPIVSPPAVSQARASVTSSSATSPGHACVDRRASASGDSRGAGPPARRAGAPSRLPATAGSSASRVWSGATGSTTAASRAASDDGSAASGSLPAITHAVASSSAASRATTPSGGSCPTSTATVASAGRLVNAGRRPVRATKGPDCPAAVCRARARRSRGAPAGARSSTGTRSRAAPSASGSRASASPARRGAERMSAAVAAGSVGRTTTPRSSVRIDVPRAAVRREVDREERAACAARRRAHVAAVLGDDALRDEEPEPAAAVLGGEERVEDVPAVLRLDAGPGVGDLDDTPDLGAAALLARPHLDGAAPFRCLDGVQDDVHEDLLDLRLVDHDARQGRVLGVDDGGAVLARLGVEEADDRADEVVQVACVEVCGCGAREREQVVDQTADALDLGEREVAEPGAELLVAHALGQQL